MREIRFFGSLKTKTLLTIHKTDHYTPPLNLLNIAIYIFTFVFLKTHKKQAQIFTLLKSQFRENLSLFFNLKFKIFCSGSIPFLCYFSPTLMKNEMDEFAKKFLT